MSWQEFSYLINGLSGKSPLGEIISIRAEKDPEQLKNFTPEQRRMRSAYLAKRAKTKPQKNTDDVLDKIKSAFVGMAGKHEET